MTKRRCGKCDEYAKAGHNYCRMCGYHLTEGLVQFVKLAVAYYVNEKFCGYCGGPKDDCLCVRGSGAKGAQVPRPRNPDD